jgi:hypothetical protein
MTNRLLFVSYAHKNYLGWGYGNASIQYPEPIKTMDNVNRLSDIVKANSKLPLDEVVILNWQRMES